MNKFNNPNTTYTGKENRPFRLVGIEKLLDTEKFINGYPSYHWRHNFVYLDKPEHFSLILDYNEKIIKKVIDNE